MSDTFIDADRYPTDHFVEYIKDWKGKDPREFLNTVEKHYNSMGYGLFTQTIRNNGDIRIRTYTCGWSGCEEIISTLRSNIYFSMRWISSRSGGLHYFQFPVNVLEGRKRSRRKKKPEEYILNYDEVYMQYQRLIALLHLDGMMALYGYKKLTDENLKNLRNNLSTHLYRDKGAAVKVELKESLLTIDLPVYLGYDGQSITIDTSRMKDDEYVVNLSNSMKQKKFTHRPIWSTKNDKYEIETNDEVIET